MTSEDVQVKFQIAKLVLEECKKMCLSKVSENVDEYTQFKRLTGENANDYNFQAPMTLAAAYHQKQLTDFNVTNHNKYRSIRDYLVTSYLKFRNIPTIDDVASALAINKDSKCSGFTWQQLPGMNKGIFIEQPELIAKRILYLKKMDRLRKDNRHIIHVDSTVMVAGNCSVVFFTAASSLLGVIKHDVFDTRNAKGNVELLADLLKYMNERSVIVLPEPNDDTPTINSTKRAMKAWLKKHDVPYNPNTHRCEFYKLIENTKRKVLSELDELIIGCGHEVAYRPREMSELNFFVPFWKKVNMKGCEIEDEGEVPLTIKEKVDHVVKSITLEEWQRWATNLVTFERNLLADDILMEEVIDKILTMAANGKLPDRTEGLMPDPYWTDALSDIVI